MIESATTPCLQIQSNSCVSYSLQRNPQVVWLHRNCNPAINILTEQLASYQDSNSEHRHAEETSADVP